MLSSLDLYSINDLSMIPTDTTVTELHHNEELYGLVASGNFSAAERLRLKLVSNGLCIEPRAEYAKVALGCLRARRLSGEEGQRMEEYRTWLELVPDRERLSPTLYKSQSPFKPIIHELTHREVPSRFLPFLSHTAIVVSSKGYARDHFLPLSRLIILKSSPSSPNLDCLIAMERNAVEYEKRHERPSRYIACEIRCALIELFTQRGWLWKSVGFLTAERPYAIPYKTYEVVLESIKGTKHAKHTQKILKRWKRDSKLSGG